MIKSLLSNPGRRPNGCSWAQVPRWRPKVQKTPVLCPWVFTSKGVKSQNLETLLGSESRDTGGLSSSWRDFLQTKGWEESFWPIRFLRRIFQEGREGSYSFLFISRSTLFFLRPHLWSVWLLAQDIWTLAQGKTWGKCRWRDVLIIYFKVINK